MIIDTIRKNMKTILFDLETDNLLSQVTKIHCIAWKESGTGEIFLVHDPASFGEFLEILDSADRVVAHNAIGYDLPVLKRLMGWEPKCEVFDTLVMARAMFNNIGDSDFDRIQKGFPTRLRGRHSLEAYGHRLGLLKGDFGKQSNCWAKYTPEMGEYCKNDIAVLDALYLRELSHNPSPRFIELENTFATIIQKQEEVGAGFDNNAAQALLKKLAARKAELEAELQVAFPPQIEALSLGEVFTCKVRSKIYPGIAPGNQFCKIGLVEFNPGSRHQIADRLIKKYNWQPAEQTPGGGIKISETILDELEYPEAKLLSEYFTVAKRLSQLDEGAQAWTKLQVDGRIHGRVNTGGAVTGRCTHNSPNLAQVPAARSPFGMECRALFVAAPPYKMVGCDASGLELRCLAHFLSFYDGGQYADIVLNGDIHTANQQAAGLPTRNMAKTFIYAWAYGAGAVKIGSIIGGGAKEGAQLQQRFMRKYPAIKKLKDAVLAAVKKKGHLLGLDGRKLPIRSEHSALNVLLQSAGALIMKRALIECAALCEAEGWVHGHQWKFILNIHDEWQSEVLPECVERYMEITTESFLRAGKYFNFRIPIEGEAKVGNSWADTH